MNHTYVYIEYYVVFDYLPRFSLNYHVHPSALI